MARVMKLANMRDSKSRAVRLVGSTPTSGKNIKRLRQTKGISQDKLSKLADVSLQTIVKMELDDKPNPTIETVKKIAEALSVSLDDLIK